MIDLLFIVFIVGSCILVAYAFWINIPGKRVEHKFTQEKVVENYYESKSRWRKPEQIIYAYLKESNGR